jgi:hypothetical protein
VEMRRRVVVKKHSDQDSIEHTDRRHSRSRFYHPTRIAPHKSLAPYRECRGWKSLAERHKVRAAALSIGAT